MKKLILIVLVTSFSCLLYAQYNPLLNNYDVSFYKLDIKVSDTSTFIEGNVDINAVVQNNSLDTLVVELTDTLTVDSVFFNGYLHDFTHNSDEIHIQLSTSLPVGTNFSISIYYHGTGISEPGVHGMTVGIMNQSGVTMTNSETYHSKMWWPCKQIIGDKADSMHVFVTVDSYCKAGSIGVLTDIIDLPDGKKRYEWKANFPVPYYLVFLTASEYIEYNFLIKPTQSNDSILIQCFLPDSSYLSQYKARIDTIDAVMNFLTTYFGEYPFKRYGYCIVPDNPHENITMSNMYFNASYWFYGLMIHMLSHQWFAGSVTCKTWQDVWLHEGFATYSSYLGTAYFESETKAKLLATYWHHQIQTKPGGSVHVPLEDIYNEDRILDGRLTYYKGAALVHMLRFEINNDSVFFQVLKNFTEQFEGSSATAEDFKDVLETTSGLDFANFFNQWYFGEGYPIFDIYWSQNGDTLTVNSIQTTSTSVTTLFNTPLEFKIKYSNSDTTVRVNLTQNDQFFKIYTPDTVTGIVVDPNNWIINKVGEIIVDIKNNEFKISDIIIYPNPVHDLVNIEITNTVLSEVYFEIIDIYGNIIVDKQLLKESSVINLSDHRTGLYLLRLTDNNTYLVRKIIKY